MAHIPADKISLRSEYGEHVFRRFLNHCSALQSYINIAREEGQWNAEHAQRHFGLSRWKDEPGVDGVTRDRSDWTAELVPAFEAGFASEHDLLDCLLGPRPVAQYGYVNFAPLTESSRALRRGELSPAVAPIVQRAIDRILEIELMRGETETAATTAALNIKYAGGSSVLIRVLQAIGKDPKLQRNYAWGDASKGKSVVFSHLIRATFPGKDESPESFAKAVKAANIDEDALLAVAFYAPQWARFIQAVIGWPLFEEAVWWIHAHTKDTSWRIEPDTRELWNAEVRKLTPLTLEDLVEGAVDVDWFHRVYEALGAKRWTKLNEFAKYASGGGGHTRAQLFADAMLGKVKRNALIDNMMKKRRQDSVRALGLIPLDKKDPKKDVLKRYQAIQEFVRGSRQFGSQRQASEKLAARIAQENLARTAGYPDPIRLQWAMEGLASADLAKGPVTVKVKDVAVTLAIDADGLPEVSVARGEKPLKAIPPEAKKNEKVEELLERKTDLRRSASRMRQSLELAMCRGDRFTREDLVELMGNVVLRPMLDRLVFVGEGVAGYPTGEGKALRDHAGKVEPIKKDESLRLAHPVDFLKLKQWIKWQHDCFAAERVQPFKQIFRELYVLTDQEKSDATFSRRYAGQQVNPRQAMALLGSRGWVAAPEAGVFRTFHDEKIVAWIEFMETFFTPAEVEGLTLEKIRFAHRGGTEYAKLADLPPRLVSEVMRDVDLIVSVAHRGAVDPEASASTVELRASLLRATMSLLKLDNVTIKPPHILIKGMLAEYSVHLGSGTTHMIPGGTLFIVPVHSQHRGRIFLPFADDDPKTAEVISKVMLLARDSELRDPNLLDQIRMRSV
jgi:hypothetical protein